MTRSVLRCSAGAALVSGPAYSSETRTYSHDALGWLTAATNSGAVNNGQSDSIAYDPAGNRTSYAITGASSASGLATPPPNNPPVADTDLMVVSAWASGLVKVVANDTDPYGDTPLTLLSVTEPGGRAYVVNSTTVGWSGAPTRNYVVNYTVRDSRGATASGVVSVQVTSMMCGEFFC
jgi:hypothetical protein